MRRAVKPRASRSDTWGMFAPVRFAGVGASSVGGGFETDNDDGFGMSAGKPKSKPTSMPSLRIEELKPGLILQAAVCNLDRQLLLGAGAVISERHIRLFQTWGILEVEVRANEMPPDDCQAPVDPQAAERADREVCQMLVHQVMDSPLLRELRRILAARKLRAKKFRGATA